MTEQYEHINVIASRAKRLSYPRAREALLEEVTLGELAPDKVALRTLYSGISRGTESLVYHGNVPVSEWSRMQCPNMAGSFDFPISYGYACVAEVVETGTEVTEFASGDRIFLLHPHQDWMVVPAAFCTRIPDSVPGARAVLAANMETALNATWDANLSDTEKHQSAVIGAGVVGLLCAVALRAIRGVEPVLVDKNPARRDLVEKLGFEFAEPDNLSKREDLFDLIFHTSASEAGLQLAIDKAAFEGKIVELSWYGSNPVSLELGTGFHVNRLTLMSSQVGTIAKSHRNELDYSDRLEKSLALLNDERLDALLEESIDFLALPDHLDAIFNSDRLCQVVSYR